MTALPPQGVADRLRSVTDPASLGALLQELAANPGNRWSKSQVAFYLPKRFHRLLSRYFDGPYLRGEERSPRPSRRQRAPIPADALRAAEEFIAAQHPADDMEPQSIQAGRELEDEIQQFLAPEAVVDDKPVGRMLAALQEEGRRVHRELPDRYRLRKGQCIGMAGGWYRYWFQWNRDPEGPIPGHVRVGRLKIVAQAGQPDPEREGFHELLVERLLGDDVERAVFHADPTYLLRRVYLRLRGLEAAQGMASRVASRLLTPPDSTVVAPVIEGITDAELNPAQLKALHVSMTAPVSYVWGPPGTGKTRTIGVLVRELRRAGKRVLVLSPYNVAVDQAILSVHAADPGTAPGLVRFGRSSAAVRRLGLDMEARLEEAAASSGLLQAAQGLLASVAASGPGADVSVPGTVRECMDELGMRLVGTGRAAVPNLQRVARALSDIRAQFRRGESAILWSADVVATTLTLRLLNTVLAERQFDHLVIDEASVVRTPEAVVAWSLSPDARLTFAGDPAQLPAIVRNRTSLTEEWLGRNPFAMARISKPSHARGACVMLQEQHRMAPPVRELVSSLYYEGVLRDGRGIDDRGEVVVIDTGGPTCRSVISMFGQRYSKANAHHRTLVSEAVRILRRHEPKARVLVLTPFTAQKRLYLKEPITAMLRDVASFETIHAAQGSEQDSVLIDFVLAGPAAALRSRMLRDGGNPYLENLLNVAVSRTKRRLVLFIDVDMIVRELPNGSLHALLREAQRLGRHHRLRDFPQPLAGVRAALGLGGS
jgi:hypothetical protein